MARNKITRAAAGQPSAASAVGVNWLPLWIVLGIIVAALALPARALAAADLIGYAVCHRIPERSFIIAGNQLPVCARDTGMFLGALFGVVSLTMFSRRRAAVFAPLPYLAALVAFFLAWGFDGFNSYLKLILGNPLVYEPQNWLRLTTGALMGVALSAFVVPLFNQAVWQPELARDIPILHSWRDVGRLVLVALGVIAVVLWQPPFLYGPLALLSVTGVLMLLTVVNGLLLLIIMRRSQRVARWSELIFPLGAGFVLTLCEIAAIDLLRAWLTQALGLPF